MGTYFHKTFREIIAPAVEAAPDECVHHGSRAAEAICPQCERLYCWECMAFDPGREKLLCRSCQAAGSAAGQGESIIALAKMPFAWVLLLATAAFIAYTFGLGNPNPEAMLRDDMGKPWHEQRAALLWLQQGVRSKERAEDLERKGGSGKDVAAWAALAGSAFARARLCWQGEKPHADLAVAEALAFEKAGDPGQAYLTLRKLGNTMEKAHPAYLPYLYHRGRLALVNGNRDAAVQDWTLVLRRLGTARNGSSSSDPLIEGIEDLLGGAMDECKDYLLIRQTCGTLKTESEILALIREQVRSRRLEDAFPDLYPWRLPSRIGPEED